MTLLTAGAVLAPTKSPALSRLGHDFLPFYAAGTFVRDGRPADMYDIDALRAREREIAAANDLPLADGFGPFWNPPFYALPFAPLSKLPFRPAMLTWLGINFAALALATMLLCRMIRRSDLPNGADWRTWGLVPLLIVASTPFLLAITHGQNTFCSLLLLTLATLAWRGRKPITCGLLIGLLSYKPQLAALVGVVALIDLGWRVAAGAICTGIALLATTLLALPGVLGKYTVALPQILRYMQVELVYMWERHVTLKSFWRLLIQGNSIGEAGALVTLLASACAAVLGIALLVAAFRCRRDMSTNSAARRDRLIAATVAAMPLLMPFYFDYDLLLLAVPAVLVAIRANQLAPGRWLTLAWCGLYAWLIVNPDVAERTRINGAVPLLSVLAALLVARALRRGEETAQYVPGDMSRTLAMGPLKAAA